MAKTTILAQTRTKNYKNLDDFLISLYIYFSVVKATQESQMPVHLSIHPS